MYTRILVPFDGSECGRNALDAAIAMAKLTGATVRVVHVVDELGHVTGFESYSAYSAYIVDHLRMRGEQILDNACAVVERAHVPVERLLHIDGGSRLGGAVLEDARAWGADLIVLGTHGRSGLDRFF